MKKLTSTICILLIAVLFTHAQSLKTKEKTNGNFHEINSIDKSTGKKEGKYVLLQDDSKDTLISGQYKQDMKVGVWHYCGPKSSRYLSYDYDSLKLDFLPKLISRTDSFYIRKDTSFVFAKVDRQPIFLGYYKEIEINISNKIKMPIAVMEKGQSGVSLVSFIIDKNGKLTQPRIEHSFDNMVDNKLTDLLETQEGEWLPCIVNGQAVDSKVFVLLNIGSVTNKAYFAARPHLLVVDLIYYGVTSTRIVESSNATQKIIQRKTF